MSWRIRLRVRRSAGACNPMAGPKGRRWERMRQAVGTACLCLAVLAMLFPVITAPRTVRETDTYYASGRTGTPLPTVAPGNVNVNTADLETLMTLPGVGEVIAQRIIDLREQVGRFSYPEDLLLVSGIGEKRLEALRSLICFE